MTNAFLTLRRCVVRVTASAIVGGTLAGFTPPDTLEIDQGAITQAVLNDASARWRGPRPCISDARKLFDRESPPTKRISQLADLKLPFAICDSSNLSAAKGDRFLSVSAPKFINGSVVVELDYSCPICGRGTLYVLRKTKGQWRVSGRQTSWVS